MAELGKLRCPSCNGRSIRSTIAMVVDRALFEPRETIMICQDCLEPVILGEDLKVRAPTSTDKASWVNAINDAMRLVEDAIAGAQSINHVQEISNTFTDFVVLKCPKCGQLLDTAIGGDGPTAGVHPEEGHLTICARCAHVLVFKSSSRLKVADVTDLTGYTPEQLEGLKSHQYRIWIHHATNQKGSLFGRFGPNRNN